MPYDIKTGRWIYKHTYEDVLNYRECITRDRERLETYEPESRGALECLESIQMFEKWIEEAGYTVEVKPHEIPTTYVFKSRNGQVQQSQPKEPSPNYTAYFRLDDGTVDACDFYAANWIDANRQARQILNREYREWIEVEPRIVVRNGKPFVHYTVGKKPVGKRFAEIIGLKLKES
jgi:glycerol-3-phosphate dehydrogenase